MATVAVTLRFFLQNLALRLVGAYRYFLSPWLGFHCRFHPTCSSYAKEALQVHGFHRGAYLSLKRVLRCHPWHSGGIDFVPLKK